MTASRFQAVFAGAAPAGVSLHVADAPARRHAARLAEDCLAGHTAPLLAAVRAHADHISERSCPPLLRDLIQCAAATSQMPWEAEHGCPAMRGLADLLCVEPFECAHALDDGERYHILASGDRCERALVRSGLQTACELEADGMERAPRDDISVLARRLCETCWLERHRLTPERDGPPNPVPLMTTHTLRDALVDARVRQLRKRPHAAGREPMTLTGYGPALRRELGAAAHHLMRSAEAPEQAGRFRWALGGRYAAAEAAYKTLIDNQLDMLMEFLDQGIWQTACPSPKQLEDGTAAAHLADVLTRRVFGNRRGEKLASGA